MIKAEKQVKYLCEHNFLFLWLIIFSDSQRLHLVQLICLQTLARVRVRPRHTLLPVLRSVPVLSNVLFSCFSVSKVGRWWINQLCCPWRDSWNNINVHIFLKAPVSVHVWRRENLQVVLDEWFENGGAPPPLRGGTIWWGRRVRDKMWTSWEWMDGSVPGTMRKENNSAARKQRETDNLY